MILNEDFKLFSFVETLVMVPWGISDNLFLSHWMYNGAASLIIVDDYYCGRLFIFMCMVDIYYEDEFDIILSLTMTDDVIFLIKCVIIQGRGHGAATEMVENPCDRKPF